MERLKHGKICSINDPFETVFDRVRMKHSNNINTKQSVKCFGILFLVLFCLTQFCCVIRDPAILPSIKDFTVINENESWLVKQNGKILVFNNGDQLITEPEFADKIVQIYFLNKNDGWALEENGQLWATTDNGKNWQKKALLDKESPAQWSSQLIFADKEVGWLIGAFTVWKTPDSGDSWTMVYPTDQFSYSTIKGQPMYVSVVDRNTIWLGFNNGGLLKTTDGGKS